MYSFEFYNPVRVIFGVGKVECAGSEAAKLGKRAMLVSYKKHEVLAALLSDVTASMRDKGLDVTAFLEVEDDPELATVRRGVAQARQTDRDLIVAVGGGSAMDAAKAIAAGVFYEGDPWNMVHHRHDGSAADEIVPPERALPTMMIPTLPATGSEMNMCSVISDAARKEKSYIWAECLFPKTAILDPKLTVSLPPLLTASAGADAISHALEIYINSQPDTPVQHYFQEGVMRTVMENVGKALAEPGDLQARANLQWAATCAING